MKLSHRSAPSQVGFIQKFYPTFNDSTTPVHLKYAREYRKERNLLISYSESTITLILKGDKDCTKKKKVQENVTHEYNVKILSEILANRNQQHI